MFNIYLQEIQKKVTFFFRTKPINYYTIKHIEILIKMFEIHEF